MNYDIAKPSPQLAPYIKQYWSMESVVPSMDGHVQRIVPTGLFEMIFYLGDVPRDASGQRSFGNSITLSGHQSGFYNLEVRGKLSLFAIYFHPHGLAKFLDIPLSELYNQSVPLKDIVGDFSNYLEDELVEAPTFGDKVRLTEQFLLSRLRSMEKNYRFKRMLHAVKLINRSKARININHLSSETCLSRKQFERDFTSIIGASPKQFMRTVRFQHAIACKARDASISLTELAYQCGYSDQAHMVNEFKKLSGYTPGQYFRNCEAYSDYFG